MKGQTETVRRGMVVGLGVALALGWMVVSFEPAQATATEDRVVGQTGVMGMGHEASLMARAVKREDHPKPEKPGLVEDAWEVELAKAIKRDDHKGRDRERLGLVEDESELGELAKGVKREDHPKPEKPGFVPDDDTSYGTLMARREDRRMP